jgi:hypothetical protein
MIVLLLIWITGTYIMWLIASMTLMLQGQDSIAGEYKAVFELASAMQLQLGEGDSQVFDRSSQSRPYQSGQTTSDEGLHLVPKTCTPEENRGRINALTESQLRDCINTKLHGGSISYLTSFIPPNREDSEDDNDTVSEYFKKRAKEETFWIFSVSLILTLAIYQAVKLTPVSISLALVAGDVALAMYIGSSRKSRAVLLFWTIPTLCIVPRLIIAHMRNRK